MVRILQWRHVRRLKIPTYSPFVQNLILAHKRETIKTSHYSPFVWGSAGHRWIPLTKGQYCVKRFHVMTSSCVFPCSQQDVCWILIAHNSTFHINLTTTHSDVEAIQYVDCTWADYIEVRDGKYSLKEVLYRCLCQHILKNMLSTRGIFIKEFASINILNGNKILFKGCW